LPVTLGELGADLVTAACHKFGGPRGLGLLVRLPRVALSSPLSSGRQEQGVRGGTEDVAACAAAAAALAAATAERVILASRLAELSALLVGSLRRGFPDVAIHSPLDDALPGLVNFSLPDLQGPWIVAALDQRGVAVSHGAACSSLAALPSHVLLAVGAEARARNAVRVTMGRTTTRDDVEELVVRLHDAVVAMRSASTFSSSQNRGNSR
jgi:cysteine desulfurase